MKEQHFLGDLSRYLYHFILLVVYKYQTRLPALFFSRLKGVLDQLTDKPKAIDVTELKELMESGGCRPPVLDRGSAGSSCLEP